jgi:hypothetical protein
MDRRGLQIRWLAGLVVVAFTGACGAATPSLPALGEVTELPSPAGAGSSEPFLWAGDDGVVYLSWLEPMDESLWQSASTRRGAFRMRFAARENGEWSEPRTIAAGEHFSANWANFPTLLQLQDGTLAAHWSGRRDDGGSSGSGFFVSFSRDGGRSWTSPAAAGPDGEPRGSFVALFPWPDGTLGGVWLDYPREDEADGRDAALPDGMTLRFGRFDLDGTVIEQAVLDPLVCSCCQNAAVLAADGPVIVYRGRTVDEVRDIGVIRFTDGRWSEPRTLHDDGWVIPACPVNGPAIAAHGQRVVVAWFTAVDDRPTVRVTFSEDGGASFGEAYRVDDGDPLGRVDVEFMADGTALVSWLERTEVDAEIRVRRFTASGRSGPSQVVAIASQERPSGFPRMVRQGDELFFTWTRPGNPGQVLVARARAMGD